MDPPIKVARQKINHLANRYGARAVGVVVAGGSMQPDYVWNQIFAEGCLLNKESVKRIENSSWLSPCTMPNCRGAALAVRNQDYEGPWPYSPVILDADGPHEGRVLESGYNSGSKYTLICDPMFKNRPREPGSLVGNRISNRDCYDLYDFRVLNRRQLGIWRQEGMRLRVSVEKSDSGGARFKVDYCEAERNRVFKTLFLLLYFDKGSHCIHVDQDAMDREKARKPKSKSKGTQKTTTAMPTRQSSSRLASRRLAGQDINQPGDNTDKAEAVPVSHGGAAGNDGNGPNNNENAPMPLPNPSSDEEDIYGVSD